MRLAAAFALLSLSLGGCAQAHDTGEVVPGIYGLVVERGQDECSPSRSVGDIGMVAVVVADGALDAPVPEMNDTAATARRVRFEPFEPHLELTAALPSCGSASLHESWTVLDVEPGQFEILHRQEWVGLSSCLPEAVTPSMPSEDCSSERRLAYRLDLACSAPCRPYLLASDELACVCD